MFFYVVEKKLFSVHTVSENFSPFFNDGLDMRMENFSCRHSLHIFSPGACGFTFFLISHLMLKSVFFFFNFQMWSLRVVVVLSPSLSRSLCIFEELGLDSLQTHALYEEYYLSVISSTHFFCCFFFSARSIFLTFLKTPSMSFVVNNSLIPQFYTHKTNEKRDEDVLQDSLAVSPICITLASYVKQTVQTHPSQSHSYSDTFPNVYVLSLCLPACLLLYLCLSVCLSLSLYLSLPLSLSSSIPPLSPPPPPPPKKKTPSPSRSSTLRHTISLHCAFSDE